MTRDRLTSFAFLAALVLAFGGLAWLNRREGVELVRLALAGGIGLIGLAFLWRGRRSFWQPPFAVLVTALALVVVQGTSPDVVSPHFETFVGGFGSLALVAMLAWVWVRLILPRVDAKFQATAVMAFSAALSVGLVLAALGLWMTAVNINSWRGLPVVTTQAEFQAQIDRPWGARSNGILVAGTLTDGLDNGDYPAGLGKYLAYYGASRVGGSMRAAEGHVWFPISLDVRLADGTLLQASSIQSVHGAVNWRDCGPRQYQRCLQVGDRVVIHGDPGWLVAMRDGAQRPALNDVRAVIQGDVAEVAAVYLDPAIGNARVFGWIALALAPLGLLPGIIGIRRGLWLRRHGSDRAGGAKVTWS